MALIKKCVGHNNINPSTQKLSPIKRYTQRSLTTNTIVNTTKNKEFVHLDSALNHCYIENFTALSCGTHISILVPQKQVVSSKKNIKHVDKKLIMIINTILPPMTQLGGSKDTYVTRNMKIRGI